MEIRKIIHIFDDNKKNQTKEGWEIRCYSRSEIEKTIIEKDQLEGTEYYKSYQKIYNDSDKEEFFKYIILYYEGGIFLNDDHQIDCINALVDYCELYKISLLQCQDAIVTRGSQHYILLNILSEYSFIPLNHNLKRVFHGVLITSSNFHSYYDKNPVVKSDDRNTKVSNESDKEKYKSLWCSSNIALIGCSALLGFLLGTITHTKNF